MSQDVYDLTIVGAGPSGLFATFYSGLRQMNTKPIDALEELGGQVAVLYPEKYIYDVGGFPKVMGKELVKGMVEQALKFNPTVVLGERIVSIQDGRRRLDPARERANGHVHLSRTVLIAAGVGAFSPNTTDAKEPPPTRGRACYYFLKENNPEGQEHPDCRWRGLCR